MSRVTSSSSSGSVSIQDSGGNPLTSTAGALNVNVVSQVGVTVSVYGEVTEVAMGGSEVVVTYTVPDGMTFVLDQVLCSSDSIGTVEVDFTGAPNAKIRFSYTDYNAIIPFGSYALPAGTIVNITGTNFSLEGSSSFNATLQGTLES